MKGRKTGLLFAVLSVALMFTVTVLGNASATVTAGSEFKEDTAEVAEILGMSTEELNGYCTENGIIYTAVNKKNTKQIRISAVKSKFSENVGNISLLDDGNILSIAPDITGLDKSQCEIVKNGGQKFIRTEESLSDGGGEYVLTRYITVADEQVYTLAFYTSKSENTDYTETVFKSFKSPDFLTDTSKDKNGFTLIAVICVLSFAAVAVIISFVRDALKNSKSGKDS